MPMTFGHIPPDMTLSKSERNADRAAWDALEAENERLRRAVAWAIDRLNVDGGLTTDETVTTVDELSAALSGRPCNAIDYRPPNWSRGGKIINGNEK